VSFLNSHYNIERADVLHPVKTRPMTYTPAKLLNFEEFISQYGDNTRYELIDGEIRDMEPTGPHEVVAGSIAGRIYVEIFRDNFNWLVPKTCLIKPHTQKQQPCVLM
jgi:Uma2 family endonuclease